jgi:hypothetical protein
VPARAAASTEVTGSATDMRNASQHAVADRPENGAGRHSPGTAYLGGHLELLWERASALVDARRAGDDGADEGLRGLYVSDADVDEVLAGGPPRISGPGGSVRFGARTLDLESQAEAAAVAGADVRLWRVARAFDLDLLDVCFLVVAAAPDLDRRFERLYGYLNDDVSRRRASTGLILELCGVSSTDPGARSRLDASGRLASGGLVVLEGADRPVLTRQVKVPDRVIAFLLGDDRPAGELLDAEMSWVRVDWASSHFTRSIAASGATVYVHTAPGSGAVSWAGSALAEMGVPVVVIDLAILAGAEDQPALARCARREALLGSAVLVAANFDRLAETGADRARAWTDGPGTVVLTGSATWDNKWSQEPPVLLDAPALGAALRLRVWKELGEPDVIVTDADWETLASYRITPEQIAGTLTAARRRAAAHDRAVGADDLYISARAQNGNALERYARRIEPTATFVDLVVPDDLLRQLHGIVSRVRHSETVLDRWAMASTSNRGRGVTSLFAGDSGTGKTMSAEVVAGALGLTLYAIDLSSIADKYVGETEKKLEQVFHEAEQVNALLLFDEADALFGKRSETRAAQDRYANLEVSYLLQRMERFDGVAVLTTNLRANIDEAFLRRLDVIVDFQLPEPSDRRRIWQIHLPDSLPRTDDVDLDFLASAFPLSGGNIRNIALDAAFAAAEFDTPVSMADLIRATAGEYRKLGRMCVPGEFGPYFDLVQS